MSRYDARETPGRQPEARQSHPATQPGTTWTDALRRDTREFAQVAEYEFRKVVGASRSLAQRQPDPNPTAQAGRGPTDRFERKAINRKPPQAEAQAPTSREPKPPDEPTPKPE